MSSEFEDLDSSEDGNTGMGSGLEPEAYGDATALRSLEDPEEQAQILREKKWKGFGVVVAALAALLAFHAFSLSSWIKLEKRTPSWDQSIQLEIAKDTQKALQVGDWATIMYPKPKPGMPPFPPLHYFLVQYAMDSENPAGSALWINFFYMLLLCVSIFGMTRRSAGNWAGFAAALLFSCMPEVQWLFREQLVDLALTAWVAAGYWAYLESEQFSKRIPSLCFGLLFSAAMLTKWSAFSYFLPLIGALFGVFSDSNRKNNFLMCAGVIAVLAGPWYLIQWPVLLPRLVGASADNAVSMFSAGGFLSYPRQMPLGMEFPFFIAALISLVRMGSGERSRRDMGTLLFWFLLSFLFWTIVPNRQLRYLLPGMIPLAIWTASVFGRKVLMGLCVFQLLAAVNYPHAWVKHRVPGVFGFRMSLFRSQVPKEEDWKIEEILRKAADLHADGTPFGNMALLANASHFNGASFNWELARTGIDQVRMRGINRRICEFAEFLLMKTESLGPPSVVNQLPTVRARLLSKDSWFQRGYRVAARWSLPDKSEAVLYQRRTPQRSPLKQGKTFFNYMEEKSYVIEGARINLGKWDAQRGVFPQVHISAEKLILRGLEVRNVAVVMEDLFPISVENPRGLSASARDALVMDLRLLRMKRLTLKSGVIDAVAVEDFIRARVPEIKAVDIRIDKTVRAHARIKGVPVFAEVALGLAQERRAIELGLERLTVFGVPVPTFILGPSRRFRRSFEPDGELPFELSIDALLLAGDRLRIRG